MRVQVLRWHRVCVDCGKEFGLQIRRAQRHEQRKGHRVEYRCYLWSSERP